MLNPRRKWLLRQRGELLAERTLVEDLGLHPVTARVAIARGLTPALASQFFNPGEIPLEDPQLIPHMDRAVEVIRQTLLQGGPVVVYGDYDVDGITATAVMTSALRELGAEVFPYVPHRLEEGYGLQAGSLQGMRDKGARLLITVDTGISAVEEVARAREMGFTVVITDHHRPPPELPPADALVNPHLPGCALASPDMAGVTVALKVAQCLLGDRGDDFYWENVDLCALGTVADVLPLTGENRKLVWEGLRRMNRRPRPGLSAIWEAAGRQGTIESWDLAFVFSPRLNAAGRMDHAWPALDLLLAEEDVTARKLAQHLESENLARKATEGHVLEDVTEEIRRQGKESDPFLLMWGDQWHRGVTGIVASRLVDRFGRPSIILTYDEGVYKGSGRSPDGFDLYEALRDCSDLLIGFGGHRLAAGLEVEPDFLEALRGRLCQLAEPFSQGERHRSLTIDAWADPAEIDIHLARDLERLEPSGSGNPRALLGMTAEPQAMKRIGREGDHLVLTARQGSVSLRCIGFGLGDMIGRIQSGKPHLLVGRPRVNTWRGQEVLEFRLLDIMEEPTGTREWLARLYLALREAADQGPGLLTPDDEELLSAMKKRDLEADPQAVRQGIKVFAQLGLLVTMERGGKPCWLVKPPPGKKVSLYDSPAYLDSISGSGGS